MDATQIYEIHRLSNGKWNYAADELVQEEPLEIRVRGRAVTITMRTPGHDQELAAGFLLAEGIVGSSADILRMEICGRNESGNLLNVTLAPHVAVDFNKLTRHVLSSSSCGLCGNLAIDTLGEKFKPLRADFQIDPAIISSFPDKMRQAQAAFDRTGGIHAAALFDSQGNLIVVREDIGRHNAVDKVIGYALLNNHFPLDRAILLVSGRVSFEILQKALSAKIAMVAAVSAPSALAVELARRNNQTLIGFLRDARMNVYAGENRIALDVIAGGGSPGPHPSEKSGAAAPGY